jgi:hypothetical protein
MSNGVQVTEKNRFLVTRNRVTVHAMTEKEKRNYRQTMALLAAAIALATLAPVVVLAAT